MDRFKRPLIYLGIVIILALTIYYASGCGSNDVSGGSTETNTIEANDLTSFSTMTISGDEVDQSIFKDHKLTMVNFWATYCGPCIDEMPDLAEIYHERKGEDFNLIGIVMDVQDEDFEVMEDIEIEATNIIDETGADYMHLLLYKGIVSDMIVPYSIQSIPTTFFVDSTGKVVGSPLVGSKSKEEWEYIIDQKLKEADDNVTNGEDE